MIESIRAGAVTPKLGIGILTYNRVGKLRQAIDAVRQLTSSPFELVIADDGSVDGTAEYLANSGIARITGRNMGVCWNKNRLLYYMTNVLACDVVLLLEDDCYPTEYGWERAWAEAVGLHGHMNYAGGWFKDFFIGGSGTPDDPFISKMISGQCVGYSRKAIQQVGFFDTRFRGYEIGHVEHSWRMARAGYGGYMDPEDYENPRYLLLSSEIRVDGDIKNSSRDEAAVARNQALFAETRRQGIHRWAWRTDEEMHQLLAEIDTAIANGDAVDTGLVPPELQIGPPHLFGDEERLLRESISKYGRRYLEFGMGGSTLLAAAAGSSIVAVDSDIKWVQRVRSHPAVSPAVRGGRALLLHADIGPLREWGFPADQSRIASWPDYVRMPWEAWDTLGERPTLIFVDGKFRVACCLSVVVALAAWRSVGKSPRVMLHDFDGARDFYLPVLDFLEIEAVENSLHLLRIREDASPVRALAAMLKSLFDPR